MKGYYYHSHYKPLLQPPHNVVVAGDIHIRRLRRADGDDAQLHRVRNDDRVQLVQVVEVAEQDDGATHDCIRRDDGEEVGGWGVARNGCRC